MKERKVDNQNGGKEQRKMGVLLRMGVRGRRTEEWVKTTSLT